MVRPLLVQAPMKKAMMTAACCLAMVACADKQPPQDPTYVTTTSTTEEARTATAQKPATPTQSEPPVVETPNAPSAPPVQAQIAPSTPPEPAKADPTLSPMDQGNTKSDTDITAAIRRSVVADSALSFTGKNVKIITKDGHVTLRGPVKTDAEKSAIESKAKAADGVKGVDNQLEIKK